MDLSPVTDMAWQMACVEAAAAKMEFIEPEHFLASLTKLQQMRGGEAASF